MTIDPTAQALHHRSVLGGVLTSEEKDRLRQWYAQMDAEEAALLGKNAPPPADLEILRKQVDDALAEIGVTAEKIRIQEAANEQIRRDVDLLKRQLSEKLSRQTA